MKKTFLLLFSFFAVHAFSQNYTILGDATSTGGCNCYRLTPDANDQAGAIFQNQTINLNNSFDFTFNVFLGCNNGNDAADGIVFVLTNNPNGLGAGGGGLGYSGNNQPFSLGVEFDTYENSNVGDPSNDHVAINSGGAANHNVVPPIDALVGGGNIDNCQWYTVRIVWDVNTGTFSVYFNGVLRTSVSMPNMVQTYFGGNPIVNWGWTGGTGGGTNDQQVCVLNTSSWVAGVNYQSCSTTMQFSDISTSSLGSIQSWAWTFGDGGTSTLQNPTHTYAAPGTYNVTLIITDLSGCTNTYSHSVTINPNITLTPTLVPPLCNGGLNGNVSVVATGGFGPSAGYGGYQYSWNGGAQLSNSWSVGAGTYTVTVTDGVCTASGQYTLSQPSALSATTSHTNATCGNNDGTATIAITGGTPPYSNVTWAGQPGYTVGGFSPGTYIANFVDANGCSALLQYSETIIGLPCGITSSVSTTNVTCFGGSNGTATLTVTGSTPPVNITWSGGSGSGVTCTGLAAGTYTYNYTDANAAHAFSGTVTITQPGAPMLTSLTTIDMSCAGSNNGQAIVSVSSGGNAPYNYVWNPAGPNSPTRTGLSAGAVTVTVTDVNGCTSVSTGLVTGPPTLTLNITSVNDSCFQGNTGNATANVAGGNPPYTYGWSNISSAQTNLNLTAGTYTVTVTDDKGCTITGTTTLSQAPLFSHTPTVQNINCFGNTTGSITVNAAGGTPGYTYTWNPGSVSGGAPTNLSAGGYGLTISDAYNCQIVDTFTLIQPTAALTASSSHTNVTCNGLNNGTITLTVSGGTAPYTFLGNPVPPGTNTLPGVPPGPYAGNLTDANGCTVPLSETVTEPAILAISETHVDASCNGGNNGSIDITVTGGTTAYTYAWNGGITTQDRTGLAAGIYSVTVTDANLCTASISVTIAQPTALAITETHVNVLCNGDATGSIDVTTSGGTTAYTFLWSDGATTEDRTNIAAGPYTITSTDANSCTISTSVTITQPSTLTANSSHTNVTCNGLNDGTITVTVSGGTAPYTFLGNPVPAGTTTIPSVPPGPYAGNLTDANGCTVPLSETVTEPAVLTISETHTDVVCNGAFTGAIDISVTGGTTAYTYTWSDGGTTTEDRTALAAGIYTVTVRDANNCSATISVTLTQPTALAVAETHVNILCNGATTGSIDITVSGGTTAYGYNWGGGITTEDRTGIPAGTFTVTVTDANLCTAVTSVTITEPTALTASSSHTDVTCNGAANGTITLTVAGGTPPYTFLGNPVPPGTNTLPNVPPGPYAGNLTDANGCTVPLSETVTEPGPQSVTVSGTNNPCFGATQGTATANFVNATGTVTYNWTGGLTGANISSLAAGTYTVTATDQNNCTQTGSYTVTEPAAPVLNVTVVDATCFGGNGSATANPSSGNPPYAYIWSVGGSTQTVPSPAGTHTVSATDNIGCQETATYTVNQPTDITIAETHNNINCFGDATGDITLTPSGGTGAVYTYVWSPNVSSSNLAGTLIAGTYNVSVTDAASCIKTTSIVLTEPASALAVNVTPVNISCFGANNGSITLNTSGGTVGAGYTYLWSPNVSTSNSATSLAANSYSITITDANLCTLTTTATITEPATALSVTAASTNLTCFQSADGTIDITASGGTPVYTYAWTPNVSSSANAVSLAAGNYGVTVSDNNLCTATVAVTLTEPAVLQTTEAHNNEPCSGDALSTITITATGGTGVYAYSWNPNVSTTDIATNQPAGTYTTTVTDANNCSAVQTTVVSEPAAITVQATATDALCFGDSNGTIAATAGGGTPAFTYSATDGILVLNSANGQFTGLAASAYTVVATDANSCTASTNVIVAQPAAILNVVDSVDVSCYQYTDGQISVVTAGGFSPFTYSLSTGEQNSTGLFTNLSTGSYSITVTDANNCSTLETATINEPDSVTIAINPSPIEINLGQSVLIQTITNQSGILTYNWQPNFGLSCYDCANPEFSGNNSVQYQVVVTNQNGCTGSADVQVTVTPAYNVFIPNVFTPNGDGNNDLWQIFGNKNGIKQIDVKVFNRIGEKVFESNDINYGWDGTYRGTMQPGVYVYTIRVVWLDNFASQIYKGSVTVLK